MRTISSEGSAATDEMTIRIRVTPEAESQAERADLWWRANRQASADLFATELAGALMNWRSKSGSC